jgi:EAL domain-containing protein (putative c-di-GMP-specific phosphodiesterase class I)
MWHQPSQTSATPGRNGRLPFEQIAGRHSERETKARLRRFNAIPVHAGETPTMVFQPILCLATGEVAGVEALARFSGTPIRTPDEWFAEAARRGFGLELELAAARSALDQASVLPPNAFLSLNVSWTTLVSAALTRMVEAGTNCPVVFELTEHEVITDYVPVNAAVSALRQLGARLAVDDAGAGCASLQHILRLQPEFIKLDRILVTDIDSDPARQALARALVSFARETGAGLIAEGIESGAELETLRALGVQYGQGYHLGRPRPLPLGFVGPCGADNTFTRRDSGKGVPEQLD